MFKVITQTIHETPTYAETTHIVQKFNGRFETVVEVETLTEARQMAEQGARMAAGTGQAQPVRFETNHCYQY